MASKRKTVDMGSVGALAGAVVMAAMAAILGSNMYRLQTKSTG